MANNSMAPSIAEKGLGSTWVWWVVGGMLSILGGVYAFLNPVAASLTVIVFVGIMFLVLGIIEVITAIQMRAHGGFLWQLALGIVTVLAGFILLQNPLAGKVALTLLVGVMFGGMGIAKILVALKVRPRDGWGWLALSGILSLLLAALIFGDFPRSAATILGILLAVELLSTGFTFLLSGLALRKLARAA